MEFEEKQKNIYDLTYQTSLNYLNIALVGITAIWISIFIQEDFTYSYKLNITALLLNIAIISLLIFYFYSRKLKKNILDL